MSLSWTTATLLVSKKQSMCERRRRERGSFSAFCVALQVTWLFPFSLKRSLFIWYRSLYCYRNGRIRNVSLMLCVLCYIERYNDSSLIVLPRILLYLTARRCHIKAFHIHRCFTDGIFGWMHDYYIAFYNIHLYKVCWRISGWNYV